MTKVKFIQDIEKRLTLKNPLIYESESHSVVSNSLLPMDCPWNSPGQNNRVGSLSPFQGNFSTQGSDPGLKHCRQILYQLSHKGSHIYI